MKSLVVVDRTCWAAHKYQSQYSLSQLGSSFRFLSNENLTISVEWWWRKKSDYDMVNWVSKYAEIGYKRAPLVEWLLATSTKIWLFEKAQGLLRLRSVLSLNCINAKFMVYISTRNTNFMPHKAFCACLIENFDLQCCHDLVVLWCPWLWTRAKPYFDPIYSTEPSVDMMQFHSLKCKYNQDMHA